jgi:hypothetical protein
MTNTLAYNATELITAVISFMTQAQGRYSQDYLQTSYDRYSGLGVISKV